MRKIISKSTAIKAVVLIFALIGILAVFPARVFTGVLSTTGGGELLPETRLIHHEYNNVMQEFVAQYDRLSSVDVYVSEVEKGRYIACLLYDENGALMLRVFVDTYGKELPGYVTIPMEVNVEVGKHYAIKLQDCRSKYFVGYETIPEEYGYVENLTVDYQNVEGRHLAARYNYRLPLSKQKSLLVIGVIAAIAVLICLIVDIYFKKRPERNSIVTVGKTIKYSANPLAVIVFGCLMVMVFPLKVFDSRPIDILFYELGLAVTAAIVFYAINHKVIKYQVGISFWQSLKNEDRLQYLLIMFSMAMAIWYGSCYMNDLYDIYHTISERHMAIWLLVMMVLTFTLREALTIYNLIWVVGAGIYGVNYYHAHMMPDTEFEYDLHNTILKYGIIIVILGGLLVMNFLRLIVLKVKDIRNGSGHDVSEKVMPSAFGILLALFFAALIVLRNTRVWGIYLVLTYVCFYIRLAAWGKKKDYYKILSGGLMMNFAISMIYSLLHRYFAGYIIGRFAFIFHTVTVTAEYFTFMEAAAVVMLIVKVVALPKGTSLKGVFVSAWKEMVLFGFIVSYAIFTVSRTAYLAIAVCTLLVLSVVITHYSKQFFRIIAVCMISLIVCFPAAFTLQRIVPTMVADPVFYPIDDTDEFVRGGADWDSTNFMCVERFVNLFEDKILGMDVGTYEYPIDANNYDVGGTGQPLYDDYGRPFDESPDNPENQDQGKIDYDAHEPLLASSVFTRAEYFMLMDDMADYVDTDNIIDVISNGRITIFKSYVQELNTWGHEEMGAMLPNGEIAVHAHNTYLQVAYDHGVVVGILFIIVLIAALVSGIRYYGRNREKEPLSLITCAVVIGFMVAGISEWVFQYSNPMTIALMLSIAPLTIKIKEK